MTAYTKKPKMHRFFLLLLADLLAAGVLLCIFALFHHVIKKPGNLDNTTLIPRPTASFSFGWGTPSPSAAEPEATLLIQTGTPSAPVSAEPSLTPSAAAFTPSATPVITPSPAPTPTPAVWTADSYQSDEISIKIETVVTGAGEDLVTYYAADIRIANIECIRTAFAHDTYGKNYAQSVLQIGRAHNAILAISGDSYGLMERGVVVRNGRLYRSEKNASDICVLYYDGTMETLSPGDYEEEALKEYLISKGAYQAWCFGPMLLDQDGKALTNFNTSSYLLSKHPRCAIGYYEPGHYVFLIVDGRQSHSNGLSMRELALLMEALGCRTAYNLDGGRIALMTFAGQVYTKPSNSGRDVSDIIYIGERNE